MERALYDDRTLVRMIGMRRTLFIEPVDLAPIVHAACVPTIVARERRRLEGWLLEGGVTPTPAQWVADLEQATLAAIEQLGAATATELTKLVPELATQIPVSLKGAPAGGIGASTRILFLLAMDGRIARGRPRGTWVSSQYRWEPMHRWVPMREHAGAHTEGSAQVGPGGALATSLRARHDRGPALVDRPDPRGRPASPRDAGHGGGGLR